jgi:hypothetical protein
MDKLGQLLTEGERIERLAEQARVAELERFGSEKAAFAYSLTSRFFDGAKIYFDRSIRSYFSPSDIFVQVGGPTHTGRDTHISLAEVLQGASHNDPTLGPGLLQDPSHLAPLWADFQAWAA